LFLEYGPHWAYVILFLGSCVEGESVVLFFSALSYKGYLSFPVVLAVAFSGTLFADQTLYYVGRYYGPRLLEQNPQWQPKVEKIFRLLHKYNIGFILSFRFIYGIRTLSPLVIGASGISIKRFTLLNLLAAVIWTLLSCTAGYLLGYLFVDALEEFIKRLIHYQKIIVLGLIGIVGGVLFFRKWLHNRHLEKKSPKSDD
jgi:membrane protein DedA with SNARE-associated domain